MARRVLRPADMATNVDKLLVYQKALAAAAEISAIIERPSFQRDHRLREQLASSSERAASLMSEGSEQSTDRYYAQFLYRARGSARELRTQLTIARDRKHITEAERVALDATYEEIGKMLTGVIRYLEKQDRKQRL